MKEELKRIYKEENDALGLPQDYKGIKIYPIKVKDVDQMSLFYTLLCYPKDSISDKKIRKMTYLKFLYSLYGSAGENELGKLESDMKKFLSYILRIPDIKITMHLKDECNQPSVESYYLMIQCGDYFLYEEDFDNIREIVLEQCGMSIEYIDEYAPDLEEKLLWMQKENPLTFNDQFFTVVSLMSKNPSDILEWTLYQMFDVFDRKVVSKNFDLYEPLVKSGTVELKGGKLQSYLYHKRKKGRYESIMMSSDAFGKIESELTHADKII